MPKEKKPEEPYFVIEVLLDINDDFITGLIDGNWKYIVTRRADNGIRYIDSGHAHTQRAAIRKAKAAARAHVEKQRAYEASKKSVKILESDLV